MYQILVVDDEPTNTKLLTFLLSDEGYEVTAVRSPKEALTLLETTVFDLLILDIMMPGMDGLELCRRIRLTSSTPIIFISAKGEVQDKVVGLNAGGDDYISKPFDLNEVLARTWAALRRTKQISNTEASLKTADLTLDAIANQVTLARTGQTVSLTPVEARLLRVLVSNAGRTLPRDMLLIKVWGYENDGESNALDVYVKRLRKKIEADPADPQLVMTIRGVGFRYQPQHPASPVAVTR